MRDLFFSYECVPVLQRIYDYCIRLEDKLPFQVSCLLRKFTPVIYRRIYIQAIFQSDFVVVFAVARSNMDNTRPVVERDKIGQDRLRFPCDEGMVGKHALKVFPDYLRADIPIDSYLLPER